MIVFLSIGVSGYSGGCGSNTDFNDPNAIEDSNKIGGDEDPDWDGIPDPLDNCPVTSNPDQHDMDFNGIGDVCDPNYEQKVIEIHENFTKP